MVVADLALFNQRMLAPTVAFAAAIGVLRWLSRHATRGGPTLAPTSPSWCSRRSGTC